MELARLYQMLELPVPVIKSLEAYGQTRNVIFGSDIKEMLLNRGTWDEGVKKLQESVGDDPDGIKILWEMLNLACGAYEKYEQRHIPAHIYIVTMKFCTRFIEEYHRVYGQYKFVWAWWFPRQLSLQEFRIGCLEYEFVEGEENRVYVHIPSDADLRQQTVIESLKAFMEFRKRYFPEWEKAAVWCASWMMSPKLKELLDEKSNIIGFQNLFDIENANYDSMAALDWVFPGHLDISEQLPEDTSLQRKMKEYLLQGKKVGEAEGRLKALDLEKMWYAYFIK